MEAFNFTETYQYLIQFGIVGIITFIFLVLSVKKFLKEDTFTKFLIRRYDVGKCSEAETMKKLEELEEKINTAITVTVKQNENLVLLRQELETNSKSIENLIKTLI